MTMNDNAFNALAHEQRRTLLLDILESNPQDADVEPATGESAPTDAEQRAQTEMYHVHLPKLEEYGYIEWDEDTNEIIKGPQFEEIRPLLEFIASDRAE
jgi:SOS-response transcriptional repressor LexA